MTTSFDYVECQVKDLLAHTRESATGKKHVDSMEIRNGENDGRILKPSQRFWTSFYARFGFSANMFKWYDHDEVFNRINERAPNSDLRITIERGKNHDNTDVEKLLAVSNPDRVIVEHGQLMELLYKQGMNVSNIDYGGQRGHRRPRPQRVEPGRPRTPGTFRAHGIHHEAGPGGTIWSDTEVEMPTLSYDEGIIRSIHEPRNRSLFNIAGDDFGSNFAIDIPIDGFGKPSVYLMLLRFVCTNGSIAMSPAFRSDVSLGKKEDRFDHALIRAIEDFNNEEGFLAIRERFEMATKSWCSIAEINKCYKMLAKMHHNSLLRLDEQFLTKDENASEGGLMTDGSPVMRGFHKMVGDLSKTYGLANLDALTIKRQRTLPAGCKVYDLLNFMSETATHYSTPAGQRLIHPLIGEMISTDYDLEGTVDKFGDFKDFLINDADATASLQVAQNL